MGNGIIIDLRLSLSSIFALTVHLLLTSPSCCTISTYSITRCGCSFLFFFGTFFEEHLPEYFFLLLVGVIILDIIVRWLVEREVVVVVAVRVLVPDSSGLSHSPTRLTLKGTTGLTHLGSQ